MSEEPKAPPPATPLLAPGRNGSRASPEAGAEGLHHALVVDDDPANRDFLVRLLQQAQLHVQGASSAAEALKFTEGMAHLALIVIDKKLPDMDGVELLARLRKQYPDAHLVMATMLDERSLMARAFENGCDVFLVKPHGFMELFRRWQTAVQTGEDKLRGLIIDQYGPHPYRG